MRKIVGSMMLSASLVFMMTGTGLAANQAPVGKIFKTGIAVSSLQGTAGAKMYEGAVINNSVDDYLFLNVDKYGKKLSHYFEPFIKSGGTAPGFYRIQLPANGEWSGPITYMNSYKDSGCFYQFSEDRGELVVIARALDFDDADCSFDNGSIVMKIND